MKPKAVITDYFFENVDIEIDILEKNDIEPVILQTKDEKPLIEGCRDADGILNQFAPMNRTIISSLERCKVIARYGIGYDNVDVEAASEKGIIVTNVPDYALEEVAEHAITLVVSLARKVTILNNNAKQKLWDYNLAKPIYKINGSTLGLVGFGNIARNLAWRAQGLGIRVIAYDPYIGEADMAKLSVKKVELEELLPEADYVSLHIPLTSTTRHLIGKKELSLMKKSAFLINVARGPVVDEAGLIEALDNEVIAGAALDVLETEPVLPDNPLLEMDNVIITPHMAWYTEESEIKLRSTAAKDVAKVLTGQHPDNPVNKDMLK